jgi:hypothetical protein
MDVRIGMVVIKNDDNKRRKWIVTFITSGNICTLKSKDPDNEKCRSSAHINNLTVI